jgi:hypothetical protein
MICPESNGLNISGLTLIENLSDERQEITTRQEMHGDANVSGFAGLIVHHLLFSGSLGF